MLCVSIEKLNRWFKAEKAACDAAREEADERVSDEDWVDDGDLDPLPALPHYEKDELDDELSEVSQTQPVEEEEMATQPVPDTEVLLSLSRNACAYMLKCVPLVV